MPVHIKSQKAGFSIRFQIGGKSFGVGGEGNNSFDAIQVLLALLIEFTLHPLIHSVR